MTMMDEMELNRQLCAEATAPEPDFEELEKLLDMGADPLAYINDYEECTMEEVFANSQDYKDARHLPDLVSLFLRKGMKVESSKDDVLHALTWVRNEYGVKALRILLDGGLSAEYAESFAEDLIGDIMQFESSYSPGAHIAGEEMMSKEGTWGASLDYAVRMVMLLSSYERVFDSSSYIRTMMCAKPDEFKEVQVFRNWDVFWCRVEFVDCSDLLDEANSDRRPWNIGMVSVYSKNSGRQVRKLLLFGDLDQERIVRLKLADEVNR